MKKFLLTTVTEVLAESEWDAQIALLYHIPNIKPEADNYRIGNCELKKTVEVR